MSLNALSVKRKTIISLIALVLIPIGYYISVYMSFSYKSQNFVYGGVLLLLSLFTLNMLWSKVLENLNYKRPIYLIPIVMMSVVIIIGLTMIRSSVLNIELNNFGKETTAKVIGFEKDYSLKGRRRDYATIQYQINKKVVTQRTENYSNEYRQNQTLNLLVSNRNPEMFKIIKSK